MFIIYFLFVFSGPGESSGNYLKTYLLKPKCAKFNEKSELGHVQQDQRSCPAGPKAPNEGEPLQKNSTFFNRVICLVFGIKIILRHKTVTVQPHYTHKFFGPGPGPVRPGGPRRAGQALQGPARGAQPPQR